MIFYTRVYIWLTNVYADSLVQPPDHINSQCLEELCILTQGTRVFASNAAKAAVGWKRGQQRPEMQAGAGPREHRAGGAGGAASRLVRSDVQHRALLRSWNSLWQPVGHRWDNSFGSYFFHQQIPSWALLRSANTPLPVEESGQEHGNNKCSQQRRWPWCPLTIFDALTTRAGKQTGSSLRSRHSSAFLHCDSNYDI